MQVQSTLTHSYTLIRQSLQPHRLQVLSTTSDGKNSASTVYVHTCGQNSGTTFTPAGIIQVLSTFPLTNNSVTFYVTRTERIQVLSTYALTNN
jgi:hypothetical protein